MFDRIGNIGARNLCEFDLDGLNLRLGEVSEPVKQGSKWSRKTFDILQEDQISQTLIY
jgi:hypothetical protein